MKIRPLTAPNPSPFTLDGTKTWLLGDTAVVDPGPLIDAHVEAIRLAMPRLATIFITHRHPDHAPAAVPLRAMTGARVIAPPGAIEGADQLVTGGEKIQAGEGAVEVIATPGHTNEHVCYLTSEGDLFTGDTVLGYGTTAIIPPDGRMSDYLRSLQVLRSHEPRAIYPGHGPVRENAVALLDKYIAHRLERERQILEELRGGDASIEELRQRIYPILDPGLHRGAEIQLTAHLIKLEEEGRVREVEGKYRVV